MHTELIDKSQTSLDITLLIFLIIQKKKTTGENERQDELQTSDWMISQFYLYLQLVGT